MFYLVLFDNRKIVKPNLLFYETKDSISDCCFRSLDGAKILREEFLNYMMPLDKGFTEKERNKRVTIAKLETMYEL